MKSAAKIERFETLDSWRGVCAVMVVMYHFAYYVDIRFIETKLLSNSYLFVDFFFVLSGFVVCHAYRDRLGSRRQFGGFLLRRIGRLWPLHLAVLFALMLALVLINLGGHYPDRFSIEADHGNYSLQALFLNAALLNSMGFYGMAWNGPAWSIGAEFYTYVLFAVVVMVFRRHLLLVSLMLSVAGMTTILLVAPSYMNSTADYGFIRCIAGFFAGVVAYHAHRRLRAAPLPMASLWEATAVLLAGLFIVLAGNGADAVGAQSVLAPVAFALALLVFAREGGRVSALLRVRPLKALGRWSYSIYLIHMPLLIVMSYLLWLYGDLAGVDMRHEVMVAGKLKELNDVGGPYAAAALLAGVLATVIALAALSYKLIEAPWRDRFTRLARNHETGGRTLALLPSRMAAGAAVPVRIACQPRR